MTETYTLVGTDSSWVVAAMPLPAILLSGFMRKRMGQKPAFGWKPWVFVVYAFLAAVGGLPQEWIFAGACWMGGLGILLFPTPTIPPIMRYGFFLCFGPLTGGLAEQTQFQGLDLGSLSFSMTKSS